MLRKPGVQYPGAIYHVMSRADHRDDIFRDDPDRELFLKTLGEACAKADEIIHPWDFRTRSIAFPSFSSAFWGF